MNWTDRTGKKIDRPDFMSAMLPPGFAEDLKANTPKAEMLSKLRAFILESEKFVAEKEGRAADLTPPTDDYLENIFALYADLAHHRMNNGDA